jgi:hypothetical protein
MENCVFKTTTKSQEELKKAWTEFKVAEDEIKVEYLDINKNEFIKTSFRMSDNIINCANKWSQIGLPELPSFIPNTIKVIDFPTTTSSFDIGDITRSDCE